jgi:hypothetical protein
VEKKSIVEKDKIYRATEVLSDAMSGIKYIMKTVRKYNQCSREKRFICSRHWI